MSTQTHRFFVILLCLKIVTGAEASQFKSMRFRNYCKFSYTSGSVCPRAYEGRVRPRGPGNEDEILVVCITSSPGNEDSLVFAFSCNIETRGLDIS